MPEPTVPEPTVPMLGRISRRQALTAVGVGAATVVTGAVGAAGAWRALAPSGVAGAVTSQPLREPAVLTSTDGALDVTLRAAAGATIAGRPTMALAYNGTSPGPTLSVRPGDVLRVRLQNDLTTMTNLHTHGLHVSPEGNSDNVFRAVAPGESVGYEYEIPDDHPTGTFWYHPHHHGTVADQVFGGLFGALLVTGDDEPPADRERVLVVSDTTLTGSGEVAAASHDDAMLGREGTLLLVNGQSRPRIEVAAGALERWRVVNACVSRFLDLRLDGHTWGLLGYDGQALHEPSDQESALLAPGNRVDLLVRATQSGSFALRTLEVDRGGMAMMGGSTSSPDAALASVSVAASTAGPGAAAPSPVGWPASTASVVDLRSSTVDRVRSITMTGGMGMGMGGGGMEFGFDGRSFDARRVDQQLALGTIEEWTIGNATMMDHPFHLHVWPMQIVSGPGRDQGSPPDWRDVVIIPAHGRVTVRVPVRDFGGRTVYHCHIPDHEDLGMMGVVEAR
ncbi:MAG: multicopper oxidase family protein [Ornithinibacter sp.]